MRTALLLSLAAGSTLFATMAAADDTGPPMWVVRDADSTTYLFAAYEVVKPTAPWRSAKMTAAFDASSEVWLSVEAMTDPSVQKSLEPVLQRHGFDPQRALSTMLPAEDAARLRALAKEHGLPMAFLDAMRPWLATATLDTVLAKRSGYAEHSPAHLLTEDAAAAGKSIHARQTMAEWIEKFGALEPAAELQLLKLSLISLPEAQGRLDRFHDAWVKGDLLTMETYVADLRTRAPLAFRGTIMPASEAWADLIAKRMQGAGTIFVVIGIGSAFGDDGIPALLAKRGYVVAPH
jgi:uncharacterized protein YbaP (TraB family)